MSIRDFFSGASTNKWLWSGSLQYRLQEDPVSPIRRMLIPQIVPAYTGIILIQIQRGVYYSICQSHSHHQLQPWFSSVLMHFRASRRVQIRLSNPVAILFASWKVAFTRQAWEVSDSDPPI